ncbi:MAG: leucine-rich repeat domain-containing protein [Bacteroidales bacterium]|nr:leucine-rich repeat domain-containing protein [Bacteroidales bacterium]
MKHKALFFALVAMVVALPQNTHAYDFSAVAPSGQTLYYSITSTGAVVVPPMEYGWNGYAKPMGGLVIPDSVSHNGVTYAVDSIRYEAFYYCDSLSSVSVPATVTGMGRGAFSHCTRLASVSLPAGLTRLDSSVFGDCSGLTAIALPNGLVSIGDSAFHYCSGLLSITIPVGVTSIGDAAFFGCDNLSEVHFLSVNPPSLDYGSFSMYDTTNIYVPCGRMGVYQTAWTGHYFGRFAFYEDVAGVSIAVASSNDVYGTAQVVMQNGSSVLCTDSSAIILAMPNYGYHFTQWSNGSTANPDTLYLSGDSTVSASFAKNSYTLTVQSNDSTIGEVTGSGVYEYLDVAHITATCRLPHYHFVRWSDGNTAATRQLVVTDDTWLTAIFAIDTHSVTLLANNSDYGTVTGVAAAAYGSEVVITATAAEGYHFGEWSTGSRRNPDTLTVVGDTTVTATFAIDVDPSLCVVTVQNGRNMLVWNKEIPTAHYNLYRESTVAGEYEQIATVPYDSLSQWVDSASRPMTRSYRYRISGTDSYGHESRLSEIHKTMHLTINQGLGSTWNLVWTEYEGAAYTTYIIYRGTSASDIHQIDVMPSGYTSYTDEEAPTGEVYYQVGVMMANPCAATKAATISLSNIATNGSVGISPVTDGGVTVYAQNGNIVVVEDEGRKSKVSVYDMVGRCVASGRQSEYQVPTAGVYMVKIGDCPARKVVVAR